MHVCINLLCWLCSFSYFMATKSQRSRLQRPDGSLKQSIPLKHPFQPSETVEWNRS